MNILSLIYAYVPSTGGAQRSVYNLSTALARRGHSVAVAANGPRVQLSRTREVPVLSLPIPSPLRRKRSRRILAAVQDAVNLPLLTAFCLRRSIDIVHCHLINVDTRYAVALKRLLGIRMVITLRGGELCHWIEGSPARRRYVRKMLESADVVTALSQSQFADARSITDKLPNPPIVIPNPVDPASVRAAASGIAPTAGPPYALFMGRLEPSKNVESLIRAYTRLIAQHPDFPCGLVIAGDGSERSRLEGLAGSAGPRLRFTGELGHDRSLALIRDARMLVLPSRTGEGCPNVLLEAMALGTPVIVSDHAPHLEIVRHGDRGEVFALEDEAALEGALLRLGNDRRLCAHYSEAAGQYLLRRHRFDAVAPAYEAIYEGLRGRRAAEPKASARTSGIGQA